MFALVTAVVVAVTVPGDARAQGVAAPLFTASPAAVPAAADRAPDGLVRRSRAVTVAPARLQAAMAAGQAGDRGPAFTLNLFDDVALPAAFERAETDGFGHQTWVGRVVGDPTSTVTLTWKGEVLSGGVQTSDGLFALTTRNGVVVVDQLNPGGFPPELPPIPLPEGDAPLPDAALDVPPAAGEVVDIFVYYTAAARSSQGGQGAIEALIAQGVADSNTAYARSGIQATLRLVGTAELAGFTETTDMQFDLNTFRGLAAVTNTRNVFAADLMHLVESTSTNACGIANLMGTTVNSNAAYGVTSRTCFFQYTFTHEVGHNLGNHHAPEDGAFGAWKPYAYGYKNCPAGFRTVLAYQCSSAPSVPRILNLSNPAVPHNGLPTGTVATNNNALAASEAFPRVQGYRAVAGSVPSAPQNLQATVVGNQLTVTWAAPASGTPIASYTLQAGSGPGLSNIFSGALGPILAIGAPVPDGTYYLRVIAQNSAGFGPPTTDVVAVVGQAAPGAPQNLSATVTGSQLSVSWQPPVSGGSVSTYILQAGSGPGLANIFNGALGLTLGIAAPVPPGNYYLRVLAQGTGGTSPASNEVLATVACPIPAAPVLSGSKTGNVINLNWTTPGGATGFTLRAGSGAGLSNLFNGSVGGLTAVSAPVGNGTYYIRVSATSACGESAASNEVVIAIP
jgi:hypothetical protein